MPSARSLTYATVFMSLISARMSAIRSPAASVPAGTVDLEDEQVLLLLASVFDFSRQERDRNVIEQALELDPVRPDALAQRRVVDRRAAAQLIDARQLGRALGRALAEAFLAGAFGGQDAARHRHPTPRCFSVTWWVFKNSCMWSAST